jgi:hypothetical protein
MIQGNETTNPGVLRLFVCLYVGFSTPAGHTMEEGGGQGKAHGQGREQNQHDRVRRERHAEQRGGREGEGGARTKVDCKTKQQAKTTGTKRKRMKHFPRIIGAHLKTNVCDDQRLMIQGNETTNPGESLTERRGGEGDGGAKAKVDCKKRQPAKTTG